MTQRDSWRQSRLQDLAANKQGAIFLGAHLGSFEAARLMADFHEFQLVNVVQELVHLLVDDVLGVLGCC